MPFPRNAKHDWNLGPTGLRGWMFCDKMVTTDARQISITKVEKGSPADGVFLVGDVILGVGGKPFSYDPRTEFGKAITIAESEAGGGKLTVTRWRAGKAEEVVVKLPVLGSYSATAPFDCPKSKRILEQGCKALAEQVAKSSHQEDPIVRSLNALALLASGDPAYLPLVKKEAQWAAGFSEDSMQTWYYGYVMILLSEYALATGDQSVMPGLRRLALEAANGQSAVGSWGHGFARPDGRLGGYGMMNSPGVPLTISLVLAREAGVKDPELARAIELSARLLRFYIGKGAIPYGDHHPWIENHEDNGKCGMTAVLFNLLGEANGAEFFSRMSVASHGPERDTGTHRQFLQHPVGDAGRRPVRTACDGGVDAGVRRLVFRPRTALGRHVPPPRPARAGSRQLRRLGLHRRLPAGLRDAAEEDQPDRQTPGRHPAVGRRCGASTHPRWPWLGQQGPLQRLRQTQRRSNSWSASVVGRRWFASGLRWRWAGARRSPFHPW